MTPAHSAPSANFSADAFRANLLAKVQFDMLTIIKIMFPDAS